MSAVARVAALAAGGLLLASAAWGGPVLDRVKRDGLLRCAAVERPGYAEIEDGRPAGRAADMCRGIAQGVLGPGGRFALRLLELDSDYEKIRRDEIDLAFLEPRTVEEQRLGAALARVGEAYRDRFTLLVTEEAALRTLADLRGQTVCFMIGDPVWPLLRSGLESRGVAFRPFGFSEAVEMKDAYNVGRCDAVAGLASALDEVRQDGGVKHLRSRLLAESLGVDPVEALVPASDPAWRDTVAAMMQHEPQPR